MHHPIVKGKKNQRQQILTPFTKRIYQVLGLERTMKKIITKGIWKVGHPLASLSSIELCVCVYH
jgi:hypothetical protein